VLGYGRGGNGSQAIHPAGTRELKSLVALAAHDPLRTIPGCFQGRARRHSTFDAMVGTPAARAVEAMRQGRV